jgi:hypothetical protein
MRGLKIMEILKHELYKIFTRKSVYISTLVFFLLFGFNYYMVLGTASEVHDREKYILQWEGPVTEDKVSKAIEGRKELSNIINQEKNGEPDKEDFHKMNSFETVLSAQERFNQHKSDLSRLNSEINDMKANHETGFEYKKKLMLYQMKSKLSLPDIRREAGWVQLYFFNLVGPVFMAALILLGLSPSFSEEYTTNAASIILSSKHGKRKVITAKILAGVSYVTVLALVFSIMNVAVYVYLYGTGGGSSPFQNIDLFYGSPYSFTIFQYYKYCILIFSGGSIAFGLLVLLLAALSRTALIPFFAGSVILGAPILIDKILGVKPEWLNAAIKLSYVRVIQVSDLFSGFKVFNFFGTPIMYANVAVFTISSLSLVVIYFIYYSFRNHQVG